MQDSDSPVNEQLAAAMHNQRYERVPELIALGADVNAPASVLGWPALRPLHRAALSDKLETCQILVAAGAEVSAADEEGQTALHLAAAGGSEQLLDYLLAHGADVNQADHKGRICLHEGARELVHGRCAYLLCKGADPFKKTNDNLTALHTAAWNDKVDACRVLLAQGLSFSESPEHLADKSYLTPFQMAISGSSENVVRMAIEEYGEDLGRRTAAGATLFELAAVSNGMLALLLSIQSERALLATLPTLDSGGPRRDHSGPAL
jgi:ankyrin repeat protein